MYGVQIGILFALLMLMLTPAGKVLLSRLHQNYKGQLWFRKELRMALQMAAPPYIVKAEVQSAEQEDR